MDPLVMAFDVTSALPNHVHHGEQTTIVARVFLPDDPASLPAKPAVTCALNGGSYDWRYFDVQVPGHDDYSQARHMAAQGHIVILPDHLGIGDSSRVANPFMATRHVAARANHAAMQQFYQLLEQGNVSPGLRPLIEFSRIGLGHSMGGMQTITQQALLSTYDAIISWSFDIPLISSFYGNHVSLFTILMTISTILYTWANSQSTAQMQGPMKSMQYFMPLIFMFVLNSFPAGLTFYYFVSNLVSFGQIAIIRRFVDDDKIRAILEENKKKNQNKKKSKFAARLEDAMKASEEAKKKKSKK